MSVKIFKPGSEVGRVIGQPNQLELVCVGNGSGAPVSRNPPSGPPGPGRMGGGAGGNRPGGGGNQGGGGGGSRPGGGGSQVGGGGGYRGGNPSNNQQQQGYRGGSSSNIQQQQGYRAGEFRVVCVYLRIDST